MSYKTIKVCARKVGMYRTALWVNRHIINRDVLRAFQNELAFYAQFLGPDAICFDVGANYGDKTDVFLKLGARVIAFEPQHDCMDEIKARLSPQPRLVLVNAAVGGSPGRNTFYINQERAASSLIEEWQGEVVDTMEVQITTLDDAIAEYGMPTYCKIDVEGYELEVLKGLTQPIPVISFEYHTRNGGVEQALACLDYLSRFGELLINITPAEKPVFAGLTWWNKSDFKEFFSIAVPRLHGFDYGDIFVKIQ